MGRTSPVVAQFEFAARVRKRREELGLPAATVSKHLGFTRNFYSAVENSRSLLATAKLPLLIEVLEFDDTDAQTLTTLLEQARTPGWWQPYANVLGEAFIQYLGLEAGASAISSYENLLFNGLLQCPEYALSIMRSSPVVSAIDSQRLVEVRLRRQDEILRRKAPPRLRFLIGETLLWQQIGGAEILKKQLTHVLNLVDEFEIDLRIRTFAATPTGLETAATLVLLRFDSMMLPPILYREAGRPVGVTSEAEIVEHLEIQFEHAFQSSTGRAESLEMIRVRLEAL